MAGIGAYFLEDLDEHVILAPLECKQPEKVLLLINVSFVNIFFCYIKALYFLLFILYKY